MLALLVLILGVWIALPGCGPARCTSARIATVKDWHNSWLMSLPGVTGVGIGECGMAPCIKVYVKQTSLEGARRIPTQLDGCKVDIEETGPFQIQSP